MPRLPKRPTVYIAAFLLVVLIVLVIWLNKALNSPEIQKAIEDRRQEAATGSEASPAPAVGDTPPPAPMPDPDLPPVQPFEDPYVDELIGPLNNASTSIEEDVEIVRGVMDVFQQSFGGNPEGMNEDIVAALLGQNPRRVQLFPPNHPAIVDGQLVDRWGTPFWFHAMSATEMEIRSAGPDQELFTNDDTVLGDSGVSDTGNVLPE